MATLSIHLLGEFRLAYDDAPVTTVNTVRLQSLLAYLVLHRGTAVPRRALAFLLWPDSTDPQAQTNLRNLLHALNKALPDAERFLSVNGTTLEWRTNAPYTLDVQAFEEASAGANSSESLRAAVALYRGELLPGQYDDWILAERERLEREYVQTLEKLIDQLQAGHAYREAITYSQQLARCDPLREETYRRLMQLHALSGDRAGVKRVYDQCAAVLKRELEVEPSRETQQAYQQALKFEPPAIPFAAPASRPPVEPSPEAPPIFPPPLPPPRPWYRERAFLQNASYGIAVAIPLCLLAVLMLVVKMPWGLGLLISIVVFAGLFLVLNWQTRIEIERLDIRDEIRRKLYDDRVRVSQIRARSAQIQDNTVKQRVEQICVQADALLVKLESGGSTSLATATRFEFILTGARDILEKYIHLTRGGEGATGRRTENLTIIHEIENELLPLLQNSLEEFGVMLDQDDMLKLEAAIRVLESTLKTEGLS